MAKSLVQSDAKIFREYFKECLEVWGIPSLYYQKKEDCPKEFTTMGEMSLYYYSPIKAQVIFEATPQVRTLKKLGWVTELDQQQPIVHVNFDLPGISRGCLFKIKDPLSMTDGRLFRITKMSTGILYPSSITCQIVAIAGVDPEETLHPYDGIKSLFLDKEEINENS